MSEIEDLLEDIDKLKENLSRLIEEKKLNLQDVEIIKASEELDIAINKYNDFINKKL